MATNEELEQEEQERQRVAAEAQAEADKAAARTAQVENTLARAAAQRVIQDHTKTSSQAGLSAYSGGEARSLPSVPKPGEPGSRFNPRVRERAEQEQQPLAENAIQMPEHIKPKKRSLDVPVHEVGEKSVAEAAPGPQIDGDEDLRQLAMMGMGVTTGADARPLEQKPKPKVPGGLAGPEDDFDREDEKDRDRKHGLDMGEAEKDETSVIAASAKGFTRGFVGGVKTGMRANEAERRRAGREGREDEAEGPEVAGPQAVDARLERFPELRGMEMATGAAARFPELDPNAPTRYKEETDESYDR